MKYGKAQIAPYRRWRDESRSAVVNYFFIPSSQSCHLIFTDGTAIKLV
jgi:hypothetical protein